MFSKSMSTAICLLLILIVAIPLWYDPVTGNQSAAEMYLPIVASSKPLIPFLVNDINLQTPSSHIYCPVVLRNKMLCSATDVEHGYELWQSNGQAGGASLLKDINPDYDSYALHRHRSFAKLGSIVLFAADANRVDLWRTDGTKDGTVLMKEGFLDIQSEDPFTVAGDLVYFLANDGEHGPRLWRSDGTSAGTAFLKELSANGSIRQLTPFGDKLYFIAEHGDPAGLWVSDGLSTGTKAVPGLPSGWIRNIAPLGDLLFVDLQETIGGEYALWRTDGTATGTERVVEYEATELRSLIEFAGLDSQLMFTAALDDEENYAVGATDGTGASFMFFNIGDQGHPHHLTITDSQAFFFRYQYHEQKDTLWRSDGTAAGTYELVSFNAADPHSCPENIFIWDDRLFFTADDGEHGCEMWTSDGTHAGTHLVADIVPGPSNSQTTPGVVFKNWLYFSATDSLGDAELWRTDGTAIGTVLADNVHDFPTASSQPGHLTIQAGGIYFSARTGNDYGLWLSDGTAFGTKLVKSFGNSYGDDPFASADWVARRRLHFISNHALWRSNGTAAGTKELPGPEECDLPYGLVSARNRIFFFSERGWLCRVGNPSVKIKYLGDTVDDVLAGDALLYFHMYEKIGVSDGTAAGTRIFDLPGINNYRGMAIIDDILYFAAGNTLWKLEGPGNTPRRIADEWAIPIGYSPHNLIVAYGELLYEAELNPYGPLLWRSNGTEQGTFPIAQLEICGDPIDPVAAVMEGYVYFPAQDHGAGTISRHGCELWKTDGTHQGTVIVKDIVPSSNHSYPERLTVAGRRIFFTADDGQHGCQIWTSNGTSAGTVRVTNHPKSDANKECPAQLTFYQDRLFYTAYDNATGIELWAIIP